MEKKTVHLALDVHLELKLRAAHADISVEQQVDIALREWLQQQAPKTEQTMKELITATLEAALDAWPVCDRHPKRMMMPNVARSRWLCTETGCLSWRKFG